MQTPTLAGIVSPGPPGEEVLTTTGTVLLHEGDLVIVVGEAIDGWIVGVTPDRGGKLLVRASALRPLGDAA